MKSVSRTCPPNTPACSADRFGGHSIVGAKSPDRFERRVKDARDAKGEFERWRIFAGLDRDDRLARCADPVREFGLGDAKALTMFADRVVNAALADRSLPPSVEQRLRAVKHDRRNALYRFAAEQDREKREDKGRKVRQVDLRQ